MNSLVSKNPLVLQIAERSASDELLQYLIDKKLAFTDEEYLESLVFVLAHPGFQDPARHILAQISQTVKENYVQKREASVQVADFLLTEALQNGYLNTLTMIIQNQVYPSEFLLRIAEKGNAAVLEILLENQIKLIAYPEIMEKMEKNLECNQYISGKIKEFRDFYFKAQSAEAIPESEVVGELSNIMAQDKKEGDGQDPLKIKAVVMTTVQRINHMSISERIHLALTGNKTERLVLIKDPNKIVQSAVIESPKMSDDEVLVHIRNLSLSAEIIARIANDRDRTKNYLVILGLVQNPKTPINRSIGFIKKLHMRDLKQLVIDRNINPVIRNLALNLQREKERIK